MRTCSRGAILLVAVLAVSQVAATSGPREAGHTRLSVDVLHYDVAVSVDFGGDACHVCVECRLRNSGAAEVSVLPLRLLDASTSGVTVASGATVADMRVRQQTAARTWEEASVKPGTRPWVEWEPGFIVNVFEVSLPDSLSPGERSTVAVSYTLTVPDPSRSEMLHAAPGDQRELILITDYHWLPTVYSPPSYGRDQFDRVHKPTWTVKVAAPAGCQAVVVDGEPLSDGSWRSRAPGVPQVFVGPYQVTTVRDFGITVDIYAPHKVEKDLLEPVARRLARYHRCYADAFGPLHGSRINVVLTACPDFAAHGGYLGFSADQGRLGEEHTLAHELAHSWWGLSLSSYGVGTKFLRESLAEWSADWAMASLEGSPMTEGRPPHTWDQFGLVKSLLHLPFGGSRSNRTWPREAPVINYDTNPEVSDARQAYRKGPMLLSEMASQVGEETFLRALRVFAATFEDGHCTLSDFLNVLRESTGRDFTDFFRQRCSTGVDTSRHSFYVTSGLHSHRTAGVWETEVTIVNKGLYETVCPLELHTNAGKLERVFQVAPGECETLRFTTQEEVTEAVVDPRWEALLIPGDSKWRGINLPSDDPWELARRMGPESLGRQNWAWYAKALAFAEDQQWQRARDVLRELRSWCQIPVYSYLSGVAHVHLGESAGAAEDLRPIVEELVLAVSGESLPGGVRQPLWSFRYAGVYAHTHEMLFANHLLKLLTGQDFGYDPYATAEENGTATERWRTWWMEHRDNYDVPSKLMRHPELLPVFRG